MDLAVRTTASPAAIWTIVVVSVVLLAFWLAMVMIYAARPDPRLRQVAELPGPVLGGIDMAAGGRSVTADTGQRQVPPQRAAGTPAEPVPAQRPASGASAPADTASSGQAPE